MTLQSSTLISERELSVEETAPYLERAPVRDVVPPTAKSEAVADAKVRVSPQETPAAEAKPEIKPPASPAISSHPLRKLLLAGASVAALAGAVYFGWQYWTVGRFEISTDDAYVQADNITIAPKVSGYVSAVLVADNERVKAGQPLARIDERDFKVALAQSKADVAAASAAVADKQATLASQQSVIDAAKATIKVDQANETFAEQDNARYSHLATTGYGSVQNAQQATSRIMAARATIARDTASLETATKRVDILSAELAQAKASLAHDEAVEDQAELNLSYTTIVSPVDGAVGNRTLRVGQYVQAGTQLMAIVPTAAAYIVANYKETQLAGVRPGQPVGIEVDMFPGVTLPAHVDSLAPASGQQFALLPPDNATGNFTKIVQRIPVKITLDKDNPFVGELRPGMSVYPTINTKSSEPAPTSIAAK